MNKREQLSTLHRNLVVSYDNGERLGYVTNVYFDRSNCSVKGISVSPKWISAEPELFVAFDNILRLGESVVIISSRKNLIKFPQSMEGNSLKDLKKIKVVTEDGQHLEELLDVNVFPVSGVVSDLLFYGSKKVRVDVKKDKISIGPDVIVVPSTYLKRVENQTESEKKGYVSNAENVTRTVTESIKSAVRGVTAAPSKEEEKPAAKKKTPAKKKTAAKKSKSATTKAAPKKAKASPSKKAAKKEAAKKTS